ncbi:cAMP-dependent protein kinase catalytic subunit PRKX [Vanrija pseudolonga]|uniref:cAMP-dependent protein kinase n=1 Tax=Vanrija pseudolonga TaxID=143232 RepID=A0AAF0Y309_9TREE|nr:cAMP-dependent protein kinase catalytic subunit PRKX [Vanrija pseudolonga]
MDTPAPTSNAKPAKFKLDPMSLLLPHERVAMLGAQKPPSAAAAAAQAANPTADPYAAFRQPPAPVHATGHQIGRPAPLAQPSHYVPVPPGQAAPLSPPASLMSTPPSAWDASSSWGGMEGVIEGSASGQWQGRFPAGGSSLGIYPHGWHPHRGQARLQDWEIVETLGTGTFGRVLLVRQRPSYRPTAYHPIFPHLYQSPDPHSPSPASTQQADGQLPHFAMKVLRKSEIVRLKQVEHINSERRILERVRHPFIVELYSTYQDNLNVYMLLSYIPGGELFSHLRRAGRFSADVTRFYLASIVLAIDYLHSNNIIYRDLKPENLLLDRTGYLRIADFGFAKVVEDRTFTLCGTPEYLAPEIVLSQGHGKAVDWWALGILAFEMLAGYPPFFDDHPLGIYEKILRNEVAFPSHIDPYAKDLIRGLLTADRTKRLGNLRGGARDVMNHPWFAGVDWGSLERKEIGAPIVPRVGSMSDSQNFQRYPPPRPTELPGIFGTPYDATEDPYESLFREFSFPSGRAAEDVMDEE